ncbi:MAG: hypothetical protein WB444_15845, partial [Gallionella sp.]
YKNCCIDLGKGLEHMSIDGMERLLKGKFRIAISAETFKAKYFDNTDTLHGYLHESVCTVEQSGEQVVFTAEPLNKYRALEFLEKGASITPAP